MLNSSRMPVPSAWSSVPTSFEEMMRSKRARSTFKILPLSGRIACTCRSRPCFADPPAESPSTRKSSHFDGSRSWQSASLPGSRSEEHTSELQSLMRNSYAVFCLEKKTHSHTSDFYNSNIRSDIQISKIQYYK